jgi:uncharacterized iron-regulated protein
MKNNEDECRSYKETSLEKIGAVSEIEAADGLLLGNVHDPARFTERLLLKRDAKRDRV